MSKAAAAKSKGAAATATLGPKVVNGLIKLLVPAGKAAPAPPVGPALGQKGLNLMEFCKAFNDQTKVKHLDTLLRLLQTMIGLNALARRIRHFHIS